MHNVVYPEVLSHSQPDLELPFVDDSLVNMNFSDDEDFIDGNEPELLNDRMGGDFIEDDETDLIPEPIPSTSNIPDLEGPEFCDFENYNAISSQFEENPLDDLHLDDLHAIEASEDMVMARLRTLGYEKSRSQSDTPGDGNCWIHGILDQLR